MPVTNMPTMHRSIVHAFLVESAATSDDSQDILYALEEEAARHDDASEEVDEVDHRHASCNYSKIDLYNRWISTKENILDLKK